MRTSIKAAIVAFAFFAVMRAASDCKTDLNCKVGEVCERNTCEVVHCLDNFAPVCGANGKTYSNSCTARVSHVAILYPAKCGPGKVIHYRGRIAVGPNHRLLRLGPNAPTYALTGDADRLATVKDGDEVCVAGTPAKTPDCAECDGGAIEVVWLGSCSESPQP